MLKFLSGSVTQGSADAFATAEIATGLANANLGYRVRGIQLSFPSPVEVDSDVVIQLARRTPTAALSFSDRTLLWSYSRFLRLTTSGLLVYDNPIIWNIPKDMELIIVEDPIHILVDSSSTAAANAASARIYYEEVKLTALEKVTALAESLNA